MNHVTLWCGFDDGVDVGVGGDDVGDEDNDGGGEGRDDDGGEEGEGVEEEIMYEY